MSWGGPLCPDRRTIGTSGRPRRSWGSGPGRDPDIPILEAGPKPLDFLHTPSMRLATLGSGACPGSFGLSQDRLRRGVRGTSATRRPRGMRGQLTGAIFGCVIYPRDRAFAVHGGRGHLCGSTLVLCVELHIHVSQIQNSRELGPLDVSGL